MELVGSQTHHVSNCYIDYISKINYIREKQKTNLLLLFIYLFLCV